ncbi:hypothetical protein GCM10009608_00550 [Pseudonocardia alaniniphila]
MVDTPTAWIDNVPLLWASMWKFAQAVAGASCANRCQPRSAAVAASSGQVSVKNPSLLAGIVASRNDVTMPRLPPPPPRNAQ